jgi:hypothetical protein
MEDRGGRRKKWNKNLRAQEILTIDHTNILLHHPSRFTIGSGEVTNFEEELRFFKESSCWIKWIKGGPSLGCHS